MKRSGHLCLQNTAKFIFANPGTLVWKISNYKQKPMLLFCRVRSFNFSFIFINENIKASKHSQHVAGSEQNNIKFAVVVIKTFFFSVKEYRFRINLIYYFCSHNVYWKSFINCEIQVCYTDGHTVDSFQFVLLGKTDLVLEEPNFHWGYSILHVTL